MASPPAKQLCTKAVNGLRIAIEGNIAAGKSTFLRLLQKGSPSYHVISEPVTSWQNIESDATNSQQSGGNLLDMFYKDPKRWAYTFQTYACLSRLKAQLRQVPSEVLDKSEAVIFYERSVYSDKYVFAENCHDSGLLSDLEWGVYCDWHSFLLEELSLTFDAFIYLQTSPQVNFERVQKRGRPEESKVTEDYLKSLHEKHQKWLIEKNNVQGGYQCPVLVLECDHEFETDERQAEDHLKKVAEFISSLKPSSSHNT